MHRVYRPKFDLKDLIYTTYDPNDLANSISTLALALIDTLKVYDINKDRMVFIAESRLSVYEFKLMVEHGCKTHFHLHLDKEVDHQHFLGLADLCHAGLLRLSATPQNGGRGIKYSYYWTDLGNAVLSRLKITKRDDVKHRINEYHKFFNE